MKYLALIALLFPLALLGQDLTQGLILPEEGFEACCFYIPNEGLALYESPGGSSNARLELGPPDNNGESYSARILVLDKEEVFDAANVEMVGYEVMAMVFKIYSKFSNQKFVKFCMIKIAEHPK